jgi:hypothetical protein
MSFREVVKKIIMSVNWKKVGLIWLTVGTVGLGVYGGYRLYKNLTSDDGEDEIEDEVIKVENASKPATAPKFDSKKEVWFGHKGSEVKTIQTSLNNIISDANKAKKDVITSDKEKRRLKVATIPKLATDGGFGNKTLSAVRIIMGSDKTTYAKVKQKRIDFANTYGLKNPYTK